MADANRPTLGIDRATWAVGGLATGLRLVWVLLFAREPSGLSDPLLYHGFGLRMAAGRGYMSIADHLTAYYPPGYPHYLGGLYRVLDAVGLDQHRGLAVGLTQSLMWGVAAMAVVVTGRLVFGRKVGLLAGVILACWPNLIPYAAAFLSESLFVCLFAVFLAAVTWVTVVVRAQEVPERGWPAAWWWGVAVAAVSLAAATMVRPQVLLTLVAVCLAWLLGGLGWRRAGVLLAACVVALVVVIAPWAARNQGVFGHVVLVSTNTGDNLCVGYQDDATGGFTIRDQCDTGEFYTDGPEAEYRHDADTRRLAMNWIRENPEQLPWLSAKKLFQTFRSDSDGMAAVESYGKDVFIGSPWRGLWVAVGSVFYVVVMVAAAVGAVTVARRSWRAPRDAAALALVGSTLAGLLVVVAFFGDPRFKVPTTPLFALLAAVALQELSPRLRAAYARRRPTGPDRAMPPADRCSPL